MTFAIKGVGGLTNNGKCQVFPFHPFFGLLPYNYAHLDFAPHLRQPQGGRPHQPHLDDHGERVVGMESPNIFLCKQILGPLPHPISTVLRTFLHLKSQQSLHLDHLLLLHLPTTLGALDPTPLWWTRRWCWVPTRLTKPGGRLPTQVCGVLAPLAFAREKPVVSKVLSSVAGQSDHLGGRAPRISIRIDISILLSDVKLN